VDTLLTELTAIAGPEHGLTDPALVAGYVTDWTRGFCPPLQGAKVPPPDQVRARPARAP
jgi:hypothetical protein